MANVPPHWMIYFRVPDINAAVERVKANGGKILSGPMEVPGLMKSPQVSARYS
jgi:predicted enzyme related to lactoylglutathione lyase